ncbi:MAG TPA: helix-turn-helix domain-containing protein [Nocardioides sp.]|uniref:helix-turn-helix domain-containing protein n=1 Tax=Nocardioides sp. TaxID=35761 RepID=UPI002F42CF29
MPAQSLSTRHLASIPEAAEFYGCSTKTIRRMVARGDLRAVRVGPRMLRIDAAELEARLRPIPTAGDVA